jgi:Cu(I)/Ag(I) efflux system protein CusF
MSRFSKAAGFGGAIAALVFASYAEAQTTKPSGMDNMPGMSAAGNPKARASATGTVTAVNVAQRKVTFDHGPIPAIGWPAMKMEFSAAASVDLAVVKPGSKVRFTLSGANGSYTVESISPAP